MLEKQLQQFLARIGDIDPHVIEMDLPRNLPLMKRNPQLVAESIHRFNLYLSKGLTSSFHPTIRCLLYLAENLPEVRDQIIRDLGPTLYALKALLSELPENEAQTLRFLLNNLKLPVSEEDRRLADLARSLISLHQPAVLVIGAGFSYDTMPITSELKPLLVPLLRQHGIDNPVALLQEHDEEAWRIVKAHKDEFKKAFIGWNARSAPAPQHQIASRMLRDSQLTHIISFNWDNLCEQAYEELFGERMPKVHRKDTLPQKPSLWKLHGDVDNPSEPWVFPYEPGRVFDSLIESLENVVVARPPEYALIVGYSEWESNVREKLISWLEKNIPTVLRVRPNWPPDDKGGMALPARTFFGRLSIYMQLKSRTTP